MSQNNFKSDDDDSNSSTGLVAIILIAAFIIFGGGYWLWIESPIWFGNFVKERFEVALVSSSIAESEQSEMMEVVDQLSERINDRRIGWIDIPRIFQSISDSEFAPIAYSIYLQSSAIDLLEISDEEKTHAHQIIMRLQWAVQNNSIPKEKLDPLWEMLGNSSKEKKSNWIGKDILLTEKKLHKFLVETETLLIEYQIPIQPYTFDLSESLHQALQPYLISK